jgi:hypothetical protein
MKANWKPLEQRLARAQCAGFMFMGRINGICQYKHGLSRRYLNLGDDGRADRYLDRGRFEEISFEEALAWVVEPLAEMGETLETPYDAEVPSASLGGFACCRLGGASSANPV